IGELLARLRATLRHFLSSASDSDKLEFEDAVVDLKLRTVSRGGHEIHLTPIEFRLLACLARQRGMVATHGQLLVQVWGPTHERDTHYLRIYMKQLRDKLELDPIRPRHLL